MGRGSVVALDLQKKIKGDVPGPRAFNSTQNIVPNLALLRNTSRVYYVICNTRPFPQLSITEGFTGVYDTF